mmetsp:Transcript_18044/g.53981  ORF Transcript_18044/g.53981 Transcript_18044/m.53981 type:complete len:266 (-) Transcript_18044:1981-2778(-)
MPLCTATVQRNEPREGGGAAPSPHIRPRPLPPPVRHFTSIAVWTPLQCGGPRGRAAHLHARLHVEPRDDLLEPAVELLEARGARVLNRGHARGEHVELRVGRRICSRLGRLEELAQHLELLALEHLQALGGRDQLVARIGDGGDPLPLLVHPHGQLEQHEPREVERRRHGQLGVFELEDERRALKVPPQRALRELDAVVRVRHLCNEQVDEHDGGDEHVHPEQQRRDDARRHLVADLLLQLVEVEGAEDAPKGLPEARRREQHIP